MHKNWEIVSLNQKEKELKLQDEIIYVLENNMLLLLLSPTWSLNPFFCRFLESQDLDTCQRPKQHLLELL